MDILNNDKNNLFKFEQDGTEFSCSRYGKWSKISSITDVFSQLKTKIGEIKSLIGDLKNNRIEYVVFQFSDTFGFGEKNHFLPWNRVTVENSNIVVFPSNDLALLINSPSFHDDRWPENANGHMDEVKQYWKNN